MTDLLLDISKYLTANGLASGDGIDIFRDFVPDKTDNIIILSEYAGAPSVNGVECSLRSVQVKVRNVSTKDAKTLIWKIYNLVDTPLDRYKKITTERWLLFHPRNTPFKIGLDNSNRSTWCFNMGVTTYKEI